MAVGDNVRELREEFNKTIREQQASLTGGGGTGHNDGMEARLTALETRLDTVLPTLATKADVSQLNSEMHKGFSDLIKWVVGTAIGLGVAGITVMTFVLNNAVPKSPPAAQTAPVIINIPPTAAIPTPEPAKAKP